MTQRHQVIFFNGPPGSGKDTAVRFVEKEFPAIRHRKFSAPLKLATKELFGLTHDLYTFLEKPGNNDEKNVKRPELLDMSWREALIWMSEEVMKPKFGSDVFGKLMVNELRKPSPLATVISDSGFLDEAEPVIRAFGVQNCHLFRLYRPGCDFHNDSRSYWEFPGLHTEDISNVHELLMFRIQVLRRVTKILGIKIMLD